VAFFKYGDPSEPVTTVPTTMDLGTTYRLATQVRGSQVQCSIGAAKIDMTDAPIPSGFLQIRVRNISLRIQNIVAYRLGSP
jgi:hypothetical protein